MFIAHFRWACLIYFLIFHFVLQTCLLNNSFISICMYLYETYIRVWLMSTLQANQFAASYSYRFQPPVSRKLSRRFLRNLYILCSTYTPPSIPNLKEIAPAVREIFVLENRLIFFVFFFSSSSHQTPTFLKARKNDLLVLRFSSNLVHI